MSIPSRAMGGALLACAAGLPLPSSAQSPAAIPPIIVEAQRPEQADQVGPVRGYQATTSRSATRTDTPLREIPQSITVLPRRLLEDQGAVTLEDALRNAPSVVAESPLFLNQTLNTRIRGFQAEIYRDGLASFGEVGLAQSLLGVERLEVIKGPTGSLFGGGLGGGLGGALNIISRLPAPTNGYEAGVRLGPYGFRNFHIDVNQVAGSLSDGTQVIVRLQAEQLHSRSFASGVTTDGHTVLPSLTIRNDRTSLTFQAFFSERRANDYPGLPPELTGGNARTGFDRFVNSNGTNAPRTVTQRNGARVNFEHRIDDVFTLRFAGQLSINNIEQEAQFHFGRGFATFFGVTSPSVYDRYNAYLQQDLTQATALPTLQARFRTGPVRHTMLAGLEFDQTTDNGRIDFGFADLFDFAAPTRTGYVRPAATPVTRNTYRTIAGFVQEQATLWERVHVLGALRVTDLDLSSQTDGAGRVTSHATRWTPRLGLGVDVLPGITPYLGWGTGIRSPGGYGFGGFVGRPRPEESEQFEVGVKAQLPWGLAANLAWFEIERRNVGVFDLAAGGNRQVGMQRSRGVDLDLTWSPDPRLSVWASYAHTVAETVQDTVIAAGTPLRLVPRNAGRFWATYRPLDAPMEWLRGFSFGAGVIATAGATTSDTANPIRTKGYTVFDAQIGYETGPLRLALTARNLGDRQYTVPFSYFNNAVAPGAPREVYLSAALRF